MSHVLFMHGAKPATVNIVFGAWQSQGPDVPFWLFVECTAEQVTRVLSNVRAEIDRAKANAVIASVCPSRGGVLIKFTHVRSVGAAAA